MPGKGWRKRLAAFKGEDCVVLALPRGGVPVAAQVAAALDAPLDLLLVRKIGAPRQPELAIGAVIDGGTPIIVRDQKLIRLTGTSARQFDSALRPRNRRDRAAAEILFRRPATAVPARPRRHRGR